MESPVCTPMGSMFSIEQTMMQLSALSRTTSISNSFHPSTDSSTSTSPTGEMARPSRTTASYPALSYAMPPPAPPRVNDGRMMRGRPISSRARRASSSERTVRLRGTSRPMRSMASRNSWRFSALAMTVSSAPIISTP